MLLGACGRLRRDWKKFFSIPDIILFEQSLKEFLHAHRGVQGDLGSGRESHHELRNHCEPLHELRIQLSRELQEGHVALAFDFLVRAA